MAQNPFFGKREEQPYQPPRPATTPLSSTSSVSSTSTAASSAAAAKDSGSKLTVGPNIKLRGVEITDCDTLVVEGTVEATMNSRVIQIAPAGAFHGTAEIDVAEIHGLFDGTLTVREKLVIYSTGKVSGTIRYGKVVIEEGGELTGEISAGTGSAARSSASASSSAANGSASKEPAALAAS
ncbi:MAG: polymer-forming cytoskeletal protein [Acidovorax sp.]